MPPEIEELMQQADVLMAYIAQNGQNLNQETQQALAQFLQEVMQFIEEFAPQQIPTSPSTPQVSQAPYPSSNVYGFDYDYENKKLLVKFMGKDQADAGSVYSYDNVPRFIFDILKRGAVPPKTSGSNRWHTWKKGVMPSHGAAMYHLIRNNYPYQKVA